MRRDSSQGDSSCACFFSFVLWLSPSVSCLCVCCLQVLELRPPYLTRDHHYFHLCCQILPDFQSHLHDHFVFPCFFVLLWCPLFSTLDQFHSSLPFLPFVLFFPPWFGVCLFLFPSLACFLRAPICGLVVSCGLLCFAIWHGRVGCLCCVCVGWCSTLSSTCYSLSVRVWLIL